MHKQCAPIVRLTTTRNGARDGRRRPALSVPHGRLTFSTSEPAHERFPETARAGLTRFPDESRRFVCVSSGMRNNTNTTRAKRPANEYRFIAIRDPDVRAGGIRV